MSFVCLFVHLFVCLFVCLFVLVKSFNTKQPNFIRVIKLFNKGYSVPERGPAPGGAGHYRTRAGVLALPAATYTRYDHPETNDQSAICLNAVSKPFTLPKCKHIFRTTCVIYEFQYNTECPTCGESYGERGGEQPENGEMEVKYEAESLSGYDKFGTIEIRYIFHSGTQTVS